MNLADLWAQLESDLEWREAELRFLKNQASKLAKAHEQNMMRRVRVLLLYAHFEGFSKRAFSIYVEAINSLGLRCHEVNPYMAAATLDYAFRLFASTDHKGKIFPSSLPSDPKLHSFARQVDLVSNLGMFLDEIVRVPVEEVVDTESNLKPSVIRKILFRLGFSVDEFDGYEGKIDWLLAKRNLVAHGLPFEIIEEKDYQEVENVVYNMIGRIKQLVMQSLTDRSFCSPPVRPVVTGNSSS